MDYGKSAGHLLITLLIKHYDTFFGSFNLVKTEQKIRQGMLKACLTPVPHHTWTLASCSGGRRGSCQRGGRTRPGAGSSLATPPTSQQEQVCFRGVNQILQYLRRPRIQELSHFGFVTKDPQSCPSIINFENMHPNFRWNFFFNSFSNFIQPQV